MPARLLQSSFQRNHLQIDTSGANLVRISDNTRRIVRDPDKGSHDAYWIVRNPDDGIDF